MSGELEAELRKRAEAGELTYISLAPVAGKGERGIEYVATYSPATEWGHSFGRHADPVTAIMLALNDTKFSKLIRKINRTAAREPWE